MIKLLFCFAFIFCETATYSQSVGDTKIIVTSADSTNLYEKIRLALIKNDFIVKDDGSKDSLTTYPRELQNMAGYMLISAVTNGNTVEFTGIYSLKKLNYFGFTKPGRDTNRILYYRGSKTWKILAKVAETISGKLTFTK